MSKLLIVEDEDHEAIKNAFLGTPPRSVARDLIDRGVELPKFRDKEVFYANTSKVDELGDNYIYIAETKEQADFFLQTAPRLDLVLLDLHIRVNGQKPDFTQLPGYEILDYIRGDLKAILHYDIPVVILSQNVMADSEQMDPERGNQGFSAFKKRLKRDLSALPDDILVKHSSEGMSYLNKENLLRKTAHYFTVLEGDEITMLARHFIYVGEPNTDSTLRRILRQLKRCARSARQGSPLPDVLLLGKNGTGKTRLATAYHLLRKAPQNNKRLRFLHEDLGSLDPEGSAPSLRLFGGTDFAAGNSTTWSLGAFSLTTAYGQLLQGQQQYKWQSGGPVEKCETNAHEFGVNGQGYPGLGSEVDFDSSGTLFLDEVVNPSPKIQKTLLQALSYNRRERFVTTTGRVSRDIPVGPAIIMATRKDIDTLSEQDEDAWDAARDYMFRIDQVRISIPPLCDRRDEIVPYLKEAIRRRRQSPNRQANGNAIDTAGVSTSISGDNIEIDARVEYVLQNELMYGNNFADLERIADQVLPEEKSVTFRHIRSLFERERPVVQIVVPPSAQGWTKPQCEQYLRCVEAGLEVRRKISILRAKIGFLPAYQVLLTFLAECGFGTVTDQWPRDHFTLAYFSEDSNSFRTELGRTRRYAGYLKDLSRENVREELAQFLRGELLRRVAPSNPA